MSDKSAQLPTMKKVAVLYQAMKPPIISGFCKPMKPGGYRDSSADIAYNLKKMNVPLITPVKAPNPSNELEWIFPDTNLGILTAIKKGANVLWANTILFRNHPLEKIKNDSNIFIVGQSPILAEKYDDKWYTNQLLKLHGLRVAASMLISVDEPKILKKIFDFRLTFPLVIKPVRGRGSEGVVFVESIDHLQNKLIEFSNMNYGRFFILEEFLPHQEITITVMPPGKYQIQNQTKLKEDYWSLPIVKRFNHVAGIAPYNGMKAVTSNSSLLEDNEFYPCHQAAKIACEHAAKIAGAKSPIRIDCRQGNDMKFYLFDLNMKPNMTGPGRPGRENQDSLVSIAARSELIGWNYCDLLFNMCEQTWPMSLIE